MGAQARPTRSDDADRLVVATDPADGVRMLRFNRPAKANAFSEAMLERIAAELDLARHDRGVRAVVVTGGDVMFAAGGDLREWEDKSPLDLWGSRRNEYWRAVNDFPKPLIAAVNGHAFGGGCEFVLQADIALCGAGATFCLPEITLGFVPGRGGTQRLPIVAGRSAASYMILTGQPISAQRARELGIVVEVCDDADTVGRAIEVASVIAQHPTEATQIAKALIKSTYLHLTAGLEYEARSFEFLKGTEASKELTRRFLARRGAKERV
jgi:enoyl-CoA hydratase